MTTHSDIPVLPFTDRTPGTAHDPGSRRAASLDDARFFTALGVMTAAAIEAAFSGQDGRLRDSPDDWQRAKEWR